MRKRIAFYFFCVLIGFASRACFVSRASAQFIGTVGLQTTREVALSAVTVPTTATVADRGQSAHRLHYTVTGGTPVEVQIFLEGSEDGTAFFRISDIGTDIIEGVLTARGWYPVIRVNLRVYDPFGSTLSATYSGTQVTAGEPRGQEATTGVFLEVLGESQDGTGNLVFDLNPRNGRTGGFVVFDWDGTCPSSPLVPFLLVRSAVVPSRSAPFDILAQQPVVCGSDTRTVIAVPDQPSVGLDVLYNENLAAPATATFDLFYIFTDSQPTARSVPKTSDSAAFSFAAQTAAGTIRGILIGPWGVEKHTVQLNVTGAPATCTFELEGSLDSINGILGSWFDLSGSQTCTSNTLFHVIDRPVQWVRPNLTALTGGAAPTVTTFYQGVVQ